MTRGLRRALLLGAIVATLLLRLPGLRAGLVGPDSWRQTDTATIARNFLDDPRILWPRINWGAPGPGYVEAEFQLFPYTVSLLYRVLGPHPILGRLLNLGLLGLGALVFDRIARRFLDEETSLLAVVIFLMSPVVFRFTRAFMPEATALLFYLVALERFLAFLDEEAWAPLVLSALAMSLAILVKPTTIHLGLVLIILAWARRGVGVFLKPQMIAFAAISLLPPVAYYTHAAFIHRVYGNTFGVVSGGDSKWGGPSFWFRASFYIEILKMHVRWIVGPVGLVLALWGFLRPAQPPWRALAFGWLTSLGLYDLIVGRYAGEMGKGLHYHIYAAPLLALAIAAALPRSGRYRLAQAGVLAFLVLGYQAARDVAFLKERSFLLRDTGVALASVSSPDETAVVLSHDRLLDAGRENNFEEPDVFFHANRRGRCLPKDHQTGEWLASALAASGAHYFVNFPDLNTAADGTFRDELALLTKIRAGDGFEIYRVGGLGSVPPSSPPS
jgi:4-amino-4-deoxy-L-arabinose transferase-like glycosyltransferase